MSSPSRIELCVSGAFERDWKRANTHLRHHTLGAIGDLLALIVAEVRWGDRIQGVNKSHGTFEGIDVGRANRLVVKSSESVPVLFALGDHEIKKQFQERLGEREASGRYKPPPPIQDLVDAVNGPGSVFRGGGAGPFAFVQRWAPELVPEDWLYFLDEQQCSALKAIDSDLMRLCLGEGWSGGLHVLVGGPGTGKTSILLEAMRLAECYGGETGGNLSMRLQLSPALQEQVESVTGRDLWRVCGSPDWESDRDSSVVLIDDPWSLDSVEAAAGLARRKNSDGKRPLVVIAVDPLQMSEWNRANPAAGVTDETFSQALGGETAGVQAKWHMLTACYRQKEQLGEIAWRAARNIAERSSAYAASEKISEYATARQGLTELCNNATFPNTSGWADLYPSASFEHWTQYVAYVRAQLERDRQAGGTIPIAALLVIASAGVPEGWMNEASGVPFLVVERPYEAHIKGLEFNHVAVFVDGDEMRALTEELTSTGRKVFDEKIRPLRIALSRARDSLCVFGVAED
jgi:hypothetical protein